MRTEISKKRGRPSQHSKEARAKEAKRGKNSWGVGEEGGGVLKASPMGSRGLGQSPRKIGIFEVYNCQKRNIFAGNCRQIDI